MANLMSDTSAKMQANINSKCEPNVSIEGCASSKVCTVEDSRNISNENSSQINNIYNIDCILSEQNIFDDWLVNNEDNNWLEYDEEFANATDLSIANMTYKSNTLNRNNGIHNRSKRFIENEQLLFEVLCGNRVSQMTRTYDDIEAVTRLLEEKGKDLELTVQLGKELLTQNTALESRISELEADLKSANEDRAQLVHELHKKSELIAVLTNDCDENGDNDTPTFSKSLTFDLLQRKINSLQDENKSLKLEASQLASQTDEVEAFERKLMADVKIQLNDANKQFEHLNFELERQREENRLQHEQIINLTARLSESEMRLHQLTHDNDEQITLLNITKDNQNSLALELVEFKQRYQEVLALLQEAQEQLRKQRKKALPQVRGSLVAPLAGLQMESLQSELMESSLYSENSIDSGISGDTQRNDDRILRHMSQISVAGSNAALNSILPQHKRIFDTVRYVNKNIGLDTNETHNNVTSMSSSAGIRISCSISSNNRIQENVKTLSYESLSCQLDYGYPAQPIGVPGAPGAKELEAALKRLTPAEVLARRAMLSYAPVGSYTYDDQKPFTSASIGIRTPDSIMSTGSSSLLASSNLSASMYPWRFPEKLQIVKPIEGSQTLHNWLRLATPTLSGLLEDRPGVTIRGGRDLEDLGMQIYTLSDVEEDVNEEMPGKQFESSGCTYTYITSTVMHPDDGIATDLSFLSQTQLSSRLASTSTSRQTSCPQTPRAELSRKNSCSTFSVNLGLASMLNERGIKAVTPSALNTPAGPNYSPTVTPCNSPEGSPIRSNTPEPLLGILYSGADLIRRKLTGCENERKSRKQQQKIMLTRLERRALRSLRLVEKVESIGLENIITTQPNAISQLAGGIANRSSSPLAQLNNLRYIHTNSNNVVGDLHFDRRQIKDVLQKGLNLQSTQSLDTVRTLTADINQKISCATAPSKQKLQQTTESEYKQEKEINASQSIDNIANTRIKQLQRQKSRRQMKNGQRANLGTTGGKVRTDLGCVLSKATDQSQNNQRTLSSSNMSTKPTVDSREAQPTLKQSFVGTVSSLLFGRKGGWL